MTPEKTEVAASLCQKGVFQAKEGNFVAAILSFIKAIEICPNFGEAYANLGIIIYSHGNDISSNLLRTAHSKQINSKWITDSLAEVQIAENDFIGAILTYLSHIAFSKDPTQFFEPLSSLVDRHPDSLKQPVIYQLLQEIHEYLDIDQKRSNAQRIDYAFELYLKEINSKSQRNYQSEILKSNQVSKKFNTLIFLHVPKAAGTSVISSLFSIYNFSEIMPRHLLRVPGGTIRLEDLISLKENQKENIKFLYGHHLYGIDKHFRSSCKYIAVTRDPLDILLSLHSYHHTDTVQGFYERSQTGTGKMDLETFFNCQTRNNILDLCVDLFPDIDEKLRMYQSSTIGTKQNIYSMDYTKEIVQRDFLLFGYVDKLPEFIYVLGFKMGWGKLPCLPWYNVTRNRKNSENRSAEMIREKLILANEKYQWIKMQFDKELQRLINKFPEIEKDIKNYKTWNTEVLEKNNQYKEYTI